MLTVRLVGVHPLTFASGDPVRAASAITRLEDHWLIAQDDANHAALWRPGDERAAPLRLFPPLGGRDTFSEADGTKQLKPDLEAACTIEMGGVEVALLLGSGSLPARMRAAMVTRRDGGWHVEATAVPTAYARVAKALGIPVGALNLEGACVVGQRLRWFQRGHAAGIASAAVDIELHGLVDNVLNRVAHPDVEVARVTTFDLGDIDGVPLAITDAATLPDGRVVVSAAAEDAPNNVDDGPIVGSAIALIDGDDVVDVMQLPMADDGGVWKVEGLAVRSMSRRTLDLLAVVDQDDPDEPSLVLALQLEDR